MDNNNYNSVFELHQNFRNVVPTSSYNQSFEQNKGRSPDIFIEPIIDAKKGRSPDIFIEPIIRTK